MRPAGFAGRLFGAVMERMNAPVYRLALEMLAPAPDEAVLEIGFGTGRLVEMLLARVSHGRAAGVDPTETMLDVARGRRAVRAAAARVDLRLGEASHLPWPDASFDAALALHCFQFWPDPRAGVAEVHRVLRPGGRFVLVLREHGGGAPAWLPNPISRSGDEIAGTRACLAEGGFVERTEDAARWPVHALLVRSTASQSRSPSTLRAGRDACPSIRRDHRSRTEPGRKAGARDDRSKPFLHWNARPPVRVGKREGS
jgi:SAM-dependent methyltransferase